MTLDDAWTIVRAAGPFTTHIGLLTRLPVIVPYEVPHWPTTAFTAQMAQLATAIEMILNEIAE